ncbi:hypothetical protein, partial [Escherichia coli]
MCNKNTPDAAAEAIKTLMHALIDISCTAATAEKHITREPEYTGAIAAYGRLVADPQLKTTSKGTQMAMASMAVPLPC